MWRPITVCGNASLRGEPQGGVEKNVGSLVPARLDAILEEREIRADDDARAGLPRYPPPRRVAGNHPAVDLPRGRIVLGLRVEHGPGGIDDRARVVPALARAPGRGPRRRGFRAPWPWRTAPRVPPAGRAPAGRPDRRPRPPRGRAGSRACAHVGAGPLLVPGRGRSTPPGPRQPSLVIHHTSSSRCGTGRQGPDSDTMALRSEVSHPLPGSRGWEVMEAAGANGRAAEARASAARLALPADARVEVVAEPVAQQVEAEHRDHDHQSRER